MSGPLVYIGGTWRSGTTLLERMLASIPGFWSVGELVFIWDWGLKRNAHCRCGKCFRDCEFWSQVGDVAFGGWQEVDADEATRLRAVVDRHRNLDRVAGLRPRGGLAADLTAYQDLTSRVYQAVQEVAGASVIVDSSKTLNHALVLRTFPWLDLRLVHMVRRSHGVVHSWSKQMSKPGVGYGEDARGVVGPRSPAWAVSMWIADNLMYDVFSRRFAIATRLRYEALAADPRGQLVTLLEHLQLTAPGQALDFLDGASADLRPTHGIAGNPMLFDRAAGVSLRVDDAWRTSMSRRRQLMVSTLTWPMLKRYGYSAAPEPVRGRGLEASSRPRP